LAADCPVSIEINALIQVDPGQTVNIEVYWGCGPATTLVAQFNTPGCGGNMPSNGNEYATWFYGHLVSQ
jgi:hypothetical protein